MTKLSIFQREPTHLYIPQIKPSSFPKVIILDYYIKLSVQVNPRVTFPSFPAQSLYLALACGLLYLVMSNTPSPSQCPIQCLRVVSLKERSLPNINLSTLTYHKFGRIFKKFVQLCQSLSCQLAITEHSRCVCCRFYQLSWAFSIRDIDLLTVL